MMAYLFSGGKKTERTTGEDPDEVARRKADRDAAAFEKSAVSRAMKVHTLANKNIYYQEGLHATREDVEGVPEAFVLHDVLTPKECQKYIEITEELGYTDAPISTGLNSATMMKDVRDNMRVMLEAPKELMDPIWERVAALIPEQVTVGSSGKIWTIAKDHPLNERFRFYRYDAEQTFQPHFDGCFPRSHDEQSHFTFIIYLNDGFDGGETTFFPGNINSMWNKNRQTHKERRVNPRIGSALLFRHTGLSSPLHEGSPHHTPGMRKYVLRTDVMYRSSQQP
jgi:predicted 2-oxoglutarate/Fe(II)-dependent dioxygenase YbiX